MSKSPNRFVPSGKLKALELREGSSIPVSNALSGRIRYNEVTNHLELSENTGAFASILGTEHGIITLTPLGGGADDAPQIAAAIATGKIVILAPGTWNLGGVVTVYTQAQELHGPAPADDGVVRLSYSDAITLNSSDDTGRFALITYDATFFGVLHHTCRVGFNAGLGGAAHDTNIVQWGMQFEANYWTSPIGPFQSEWFLQWRDAGPAPAEIRPLQVYVVHSTGKCHTGISGSLEVVPDGLTVARLSVPNGLSPVVHTGAANWLDDTGIVPKVGFTSWGVLLFNGVRLFFPAANTNPWISCDAADRGHGVAPGSLLISGPTNTHDDTPLTGYVSFDTPIKKPSHTVAQLNAAPLALVKAQAGTEAFCTDETGGAVPVFSDGTDWRRVTDRAIIS
jgi:hypothetical protein